LNPANEISNGTRAFEAGREAAKVKQWKEAQKQFSAALTIDRSNPVWAYAYAEALMKNRRWVDALLGFDAVIALSPDAPLLASAYFSRGKCLTKVRKWEQAELAISKGLALTRPTARHYFQYANCLSKLQRKEEAVSFFEKAVKKAPKKQKYVAAFADSLAACGKTTEVESLLRNSLVRHPTSSILYIRLVEFLTATDRKSEAESICLEALSAVPTDAKLHAMLGKLFANSGRYSEAAEAYGRAIALDSSQSGWHVTLADVMTRLNPESYFRPGLEHTHGYEYSGKKSNVLFIVLSPYANRSVLTRRSFYGDTLFVYEKRVTFYTYNQTALTTFISDLIQDNEYQKVCIFGSSKGGFGALSLAPRLAAACLETSFFTAAFSPQTMLWPANENISGLGSYRRLKRSAKTSPTTDQDLKANGSLAWLGEVKIPNLEGQVVFGELFERDRTEAIRLQSVKFLRMVPIPKYALHTTGALFLLEGDALKQIVSGRFAQAGDDAYFMPENAEQLAADFLRTLDPNKYKLETMLEQWLAKPKAT
jgi:tetratricopeptide (TPR) repeat protein